MGTTSSKHLRPCGAPRRGRKSLDSLTACADRHATAEALGGHLPHARRLLAASVLQSQAVELALYRGVALTGRRFQAWPVENGDTPMHVADQPRFLECTGDNRHGWTSGTQHHREELVAQVWGLADLAHGRRQAQKSNSSVARFGRDFGTLTLLDAMVAIGDGASISSMA
jgi:hypothetical protein